MERTFSMSTIERKLGHLTSTKELFDQERLDTTDINKQIDELTKMKTALLSKPGKVLPLETINRRLEEKTATVQMLLDMGEDPSTVQKEIDDLRRQKAMLEGPSMSSGKFPIKILCFDLDETILTSADPSVRAGNLSGLTCVGQANISPGMVDVVVNSKVIRLLEECTKRDNIKWFIVSRGNNTEKLDVFMQYCASKGKQVMPDNEQYGINPFKNKDKKSIVQKIINKSRADFEIRGVLFADDDKNNVSSVASLGDITPINIPENTWQADWLPITLLTDANIRNCMSFAGVPMGALKKRKKTRRKSDKSKNKSSKSKSGSKQSKKNKKNKKNKKKKLFIR